MSTERFAVTTNAQKHFTTFPEGGKCPLLPMPAGALGNEMFRLLCETAVDGSMHVFVIRCSRDTINTFKDRLDKFWANQDVLSDYKSYLHGIGTRRIIM